MIVRVADDLAIEASMIVSVSFKHDDGSITLEISNGTKWDLHGRSKRYFNKIIKDIQEKK